MKFKDLAELLILGAIWGASFMLMKEAVPAFGIFALVEFRAIGASLCLLPLVYLKKQQSDLFLHWKKLAFIGLINTAIPFCLFNYAVIQIDASLAAILNACAPMFGVVVAWLYLKESIGVWGIVGVLLGFVGVVFISVDPSTSDGAALLPVLAALGATLCYAITASYVKKHLSTAKPFAIAAGSQVSTAIILFVPALLDLPEQMPSLSGWTAGIILSIVCTGIAYIMYFDLISKIGASRAITVGYLVPLFGILWGVSLLGETLSLKQIAGSMCILVGVMLATNVAGLLRDWRKGSRVT